MLQASICVGYIPADVSVWNTWKEIRREGSLNTLLDCSSQLIFCVYSFCPRSYSLTGTFSENGV